MITSRFIQLLIVMFTLSCCYPLLAFSKESVLTLSEAESLALSTSPELQRFQATNQSLQQQAIADRQLTDPQLVAGVINVPTNNFSFTQDEMTMKQIGVQQLFPRGHSLKVKSQQTEALAHSETRKLQGMTLTLVRNVRETWLELYYWTKALHVLKENRSLYKNLLKVTESIYQTGKINQSAVLQVQLELSKLNDQAIQIEQQIQVLRAQLARWIGINQNTRPLALTLPHWPNPPTLEQLHKRLQQHPVLQADTANVDASRYEVAYAKEQYKPGWLLGVGYGFRQGNMANGMPRSDMLTAQVTMDLPIFTANRQNRQVMAGYNRLQATKLEQQIHYRDLQQALSTQYTIWTHLSSRETVYKTQVIPTAKQNARAALIAYQNTTAELTNVLQAYSSVLTLNLELIQLQVNRAKSHATLLYLEGNSK